MDEGPAPLELSPEREHLGVGPARFVFQSFSDCSFDGGGFALNLLPTTRERCGMAANTGETELAKLAEQLLGALRSAAKVENKNPNTMLAAVRAFPQLEMASP